MVKIDHFHWQITKKCLYFFKKEIDLISANHIAAAPIPKIGIPK